MGWTPEEVWFHSRQWQNVFWFRASAAMLMRSALFWDITRRRVVIVYRRFGTTYRSHLQGSGIPLATLRASLHHPPPPLNFSSSNLFIFIFNFYCLFYLYFIYLALSLYIHPLLLFYSIYFFPAVLGDCILGTPSSFTLSVSTPLSPWFNPIDCHHSYWLLPRAHFPI
jgi:hypothetical protein